MVHFLLIVYCFLWLLLGNGIAVADELPTNTEQLCVTKSPRLESTTDLANKGDIAAQLLLAESYFKGDCSPINKEKALFWYQKAALLGNPKAQFYLAYFYKIGDYIEQNYPMAFSLYLKSAEQGYIDAQYFVGYYYEKGRGVRQNLDKSFYWYAKAANQGDASSQYRLGYFYYKGIGTRKDNVQAYVWTKLAQRSGVGIAEELSTLLSNQLSPAEIEAAEDFIANWKPKSGNLDVK